ncbi:iron complex transport system substrate-binding protein [Marinobacter mobilis]|uniref:Iron complex transport system substrate-binding protein n=2 Tax=Marinobacter mobilis TaxID=488533 RepID=A0A1H2ZVW3_9GAMM|nr:iron complex transport system substrate-binding protein [Marinobacter mobilis]
MASLWGYWKERPGTGYLMSTDQRRIPLRAIRTHLLYLLSALMFVSPWARAGSWQHERGTLTLDTIPERVVSLNWAATEALLLLGVTPVGMADRDYYPVWVQEPPLPEGIANVGARSAPSLEAISELQPDLIVTSGQLAPAYEQISAMAPTYVISVYDKDVNPAEQARNMLLTLGEMLGREARAHEVINRINAEIAANRARLKAAGLTDRPLSVVSFMDDRHVRINTSNGLLQAGLEGLGLSNAWPQPGNFWGFSMVGLESLAPLTDARLVVISPTLPGLREQLQQSPFWRHLPAVANNEVFQIDPVWTFGGVNAVRRFSELLTQALLAGGSDNVR